MSGHHISVAVFWYGSLEALDLWYQKTLAAYSEIDLRSSRKYAEQVHNLFNIFVNTMGTLLVLDQHERLYALLQSLGFTWDKDGFDCIDDWATNHIAGLPPSALPAVNPIDSYNASIRLLLFLSSPSGAIDESEVRAWIPSPQALAELHRDSHFSRMFGSYDIALFGPRAFLKLGRDDDAYELCRLTVASDVTNRKTTLVSCYSILGEIAAKRGNFEDADGHIATALAEAKLSRLPMLELLAARDWKRHVLAPQGRDASGAEVVIDGACAKMKKTREQLASIL